MGNHGASGLLTSLETIRREGRLGAGFAGARESRSSSLLRSFASPWSAGAHASREADPRHVLDMRTRSEAALILDPDRGLGISTLAIVGDRGAGGA
jgi:hypothetical protein